MSEDIHLGLGECARAQRLCAAAAHDRNSGQLGRHLREQAFADLLADLGAGFALEEFDALRLLGGQLFKHAFRPQQGPGNSPFGFHQRQAQVAAVVGRLLGNLAVQEVPPGNPAVHGISSQTIQRRRSVACKPLHVIVGEGAGKVEHAETGAAAFKTHGR